MLVYGRGTIQDHPQISSPELYDYGLSFDGVEPSFNIPPKRGVDGVCYAQYVLTTWMMVTQVVVSHTFSILKPIYNDLHWYNQIGFPWKTQIQINIGSEDHVPNSRTVSNGN